jgi:hypothetical protein
VTSEAPPVTGPALQVKDLRVTYGPKRAVDGVSSGGTVETLLSGAMNNPSSWNSDTWLALAVSTAYSVVFAGIGIRWFQWGAR